MLIQKESYNMNNNFSVGDTVKIRSTGQVGKIVGIDGGRWVVEVSGTRQVCEDYKLEKREILLG